MRKIFLLLFISLLVTSCGQNDNKQKEFDLQKRELDLKQKELELKEKQFALDSVQKSNNTIIKTTTENNDLPVTNSIKYTSKELTKTQLDINKFAGNWMGEEADLILIRVIGNSVIVYSDYDNNKEINFKGTAIDNYTFETTDYNRQKSGKSIWRLNNGVITVTTKGKEVYRYGKN